MVSSPPEFIALHKKVITPNQQFSIKLRCKGFSSFKLEKDVDAYRIRIVKLPEKKQNWLKYKQYFFNQFVLTPPSWSTNLGYELVQQKLRIFIKSWLQDNTPDYDIILDTSKFLSNDDPNYSEYFF